VDTECGHKLHYMYKLNIYPSIGSTVFLSYDTRRSGHTITSVSSDRHKRCGMKEIGISKHMLVVFRPAIINIIHTPFTQTNSPNNLLMKQ